MKFELDDYHRNLSDRELIDDLKYVADLIKKNTMNVDIFTLRR